MPPKHPKRSRSRENKLQRELIFGKNILLKTDREWRQLCSKISLSKLRDEVIFVWRSFEKIIDMKDFTISLYMDKIHNHEDTQIQNYREQQESIRKLLLMLDAQLNKIHEENEEKFKSLVSKSLEEMDVISKTGEETQDRLKSLIFTMNKERKIFDKNMKTEFYTLNTKRTDQIASINNLSAELEEKFKQISNQKQAVFNDYYTHLAVHKKEHEQLYKLELWNKKATLKRLKKLMSLKYSTVFLNQQLKQLTNEIGSRLCSLQTEYQTLNECAFALKNKLMWDRNQDSMKRCMMTTEFVKVFDYLKNITKKGEKMVTMIANANKYETLPEVLQPFPIIFKDIPADSENHIIPQLRYFWAKIANIESNRYALNEEKVFLKKENYQLRKAIHSYCQCLKCPALPPIPSRAGNIPRTDGKELMRRYKNQESAKIDSVRLSKIRSLAQGPAKWRGMRDSISGDKLD